MVGQTQGHVSESQHQNHHHYCPRMRGNHAQLGCSDLVRALQHCLMDHAQAASSQLMSQLAEGSSWQTLALQVWVSTLLRRTRS